MSLGIMVGRGREKVGVPRWIHLFVQGLTHGLQQQIMVAEVGAEGMLTVRIKVIMLLGVAEEVYHGLCFLYFTFKVF